MKRFTLLLLSFSLVLSLAAPAGAVFASEGIVEKYEEDIKGAEQVEELVATVPSQGNETEEEAEVIEPAEASAEQQGSQNTQAKNLEPQDLVSDHVGEPLEYRNVVVTQVQTSGGSGRTGEELIEIRNNSSEDVDVTHWKIVSTNEEIVTILPEDNRPGHRVLLPAGASALFVTTAFRSAHTTQGQLFAADGVFANGKITNADGSVRLYDAAGSYVSGVAWGVGIAADGTPMSKLPSGGGIIERRVLSDEWHQDTRDNMADFVLASSLREEYEVGVLEERFDACMNIVGFQSRVPDGLYRDEVVGYCTDEPPSVNVCSGIIISEIGANSNEQFIEIHNSTDEVVVVGGCQLQTNRSTKTYVFADGEVVEPRGFLAIAVDESGLALTKTTQGTVYLLSSHGLHEVDSQSYSSLSQDTSWSLVDGVWYQTYAITPGTANIYKKYLPCEEGYWRNEETGRCNKTIEAVVTVDCGEGRERNPATGRCRNIPTDKELAPCKDGQYRSEETNRCRSIATTAASVLKPCADDQFRNPATNRCKKIASTEELADCGEGRERNPETNRCRNVLSTAMPTAAFAPEAVTQTAQSMLGWWALGGVTLVALGYAGWQWRFEVSRALRRIGQVFSAGPKP